MKRKTLLFAFVAPLFLSACVTPVQPAQSESQNDVSSAQPVHSHTYSDEWAFDETHHWHAATCEHTAEVSDKAEHIFGEWIVDEEATYYVDGQRHHVCSVCGFSATESFEKEFLNEEGLAFSLLDDGTYGVSVGQATELSKIEIPRKFNGRTVSTILGYETGNNPMNGPDPYLIMGNQRGFSDCTKLKTIVLPNSITSIGHGAFYCCNSLESINLPDGLEEIGLATFYGCSSLPELVVPASVKSIMHRAFHDCGQLQSVNIPEGVTAINTSTFQGCHNLASVVIPSTVKSIGSSAFEDCYALQSLELPQSVKTIGKHAFWRCTKLASIKMFDNVTDIGEEACGYCSALVYIDVTIADMANFINMKGKENMVRTYDTFLGIRLFDQSGQEIVDAVVPNGVSTLKKCAFDCCVNLTSITLPKSLTRIEDRALRCCSSIRTITIPSGVAYISENEVFDWCDSLEAINVDSENASYASFEGILLNKDMTKLIRCPQQKEGAVVVPNTVKVIGKEAFHSCKKLTSISLPETLTSIGSTAFYSCSSVTSIRMPQTLENHRIEGWTFANCHRLASIDVPEGITSIGYGAFGACAALRSIIIPRSVTWMDYDVFIYCDSLKWAVVPLVYCTATGYQGYSFQSWFKNCPSLENIFFYNYNEVLENVYPGLCSFYSEEEPTANDHAYWHFVDGAPVIWPSENA